MIGSEFLVIEAAITLSVAISKDVGPYLFWIVFELLLLLKPLLELILGLEPGTTLVSTLSVDKLLFVLFDGQIDLFLEIFELIEFPLEIQHVFILSSGIDFGSTDGLSSNCNLTKE